MKSLKFIITHVILLFSITASAQNANILLIRAHHPNDEHTITRIWRTPDNTYIIRTSYSEKEYDFSQNIVYQFNKNVEYDGLSKIVTWKANDVGYSLAYANGVFALVIGFFSEALNDIISTPYIIDYINKEAFNNL